MCHCNILWKFGTVLRSIFILGMKHCSNGYSREEHMYLCFVDLENVFDLISWGLMWGVLRKNWVLGPLQWGYFSSCICSVRNWFASLDSFPVGLGLCQGCSYPLSYYFLWTEFLGAVKRWTVSSLVALGSCFCFLQMMCVCVFFRFINWHLAPFIGAICSWVWNG